MIQEHAVNQHVSKSLYERNILDIYVDILSVTDSDILGVTYFVIGLNVIPNMAVKTKPKLV